MSIAERIAALKLQEVGKTPQSPPPSYDQAVAGAPRKGPPPPLPKKRDPAFLERQNTTNIPLIGPHASAGDGTIGNLPAGAKPKVRVVQSSEQADGAPPGLPSRPAARPEKSPALPPRRPSASPSFSPETTLTRRGSSESTSSAISSISSISARPAVPSRTSTASQQFTIRAPAYDATKLPPLPPKREKQEVQQEQPKGRLTSTRSTPNVLARPTQDVTDCSSRPPSLPSRTPSAQAPERTPLPRKSALSMGFSSGANTTPPVSSSRPGLPDPAPVNGAPPPVPRSSRPDLSAIMASKPKPGNAATPTSGSCLRCRDLSAVDAHAARFPRQSIPCTDLSWLANQLTSPFPSLTDKARAIFTWLHHNIDYDTVAFYNNAVKPSTPASTVATGLAVCEGYAGLFTALASKCGLESVVVGGHGKGYGYAPSSPGAPLPAFKAGHAWNAVRIDGGDWKLIDPCWGAGNVSGPGKPYNRSFTPVHFTKDNNEFGDSHFPADARFFYRTDGRPSISWEEYLIGGPSGGEGPQMYGGYSTAEGISERSIQPFTKKISLGQVSNGPTMRFQFNKICPHWDNERMGKGKHYCYMIQTNRGGRGDVGHMVPFETDGNVWWADVPVHELGEPGQQVKLAALTGFDGGDGRGLRAETWRSKEGTVGWGAGYVAHWDLV